MSPTPPDEVLPVLVADLADDEARDVLDAAASTGRRVYVPLESAPVALSEHLLEVHLPGAPEPLYYIAEPSGLPTEDGFPLKLRLVDGARSDARPGDQTGFVRGRHGANVESLSESHREELSHVGPLPTEDTPKDLLGRALAGGKLVIESLIGRGGVGAVYKARHRELRMSVAVKVLHASFQSDVDFCRRFYAEALAASRLDHPNVTRVIDFGQEPDGLLYLAMEFLNGVELRDVLDRERKLPTRRLAELMMQTCAGLSHAHSRGIVHRDIKPENLMLVPGHDDDGEAIELVKVCDFGIAQHRADANAEQGVIAGTPEYMSPEQCRGDELDPRSDVYAVGVVLYELATGQVPFQGESPQAVLQKQQHTPVLSPTKVDPTVDPSLEKIILRALEKNVNARYPSLRDLRADLRALVVQASGASPSPASVVATGAFPRAREPEWLERGGAYQHVTAPASSTRTTGVQNLGSPSDEIVEALSQNPRGWAARLSSTTDPRAFTQIASHIESAVRTLAARGNTTALWAISSALHNVAMESVQGAQSRSSVASRVLRVFDDPSVLAAVAEKLFTGDEETRDHARRLVLNAGVAGAHGLYSARVKLAAEASVRAPFVTVLKDFGPKAWPVVRAVLEKILFTELNNATAELAEDLLLAVPTVGDEQAGHLVVKYLRVNHARICRAATASIVKIWGERAKPLLIGMLQSKDDVVRVAGIAGLRQLNRVDEHVVPRLQGFLVGRTPASDEVRGAVVVALGSATESARQPAISMLTLLLRTHEVADPRALRGPMTQKDAVVLAAARSILQLGGKPYASVVSERAERAHDPLRSELKKLLS